MARSSGQILLNNLIIQMLTSSQNKTKKTFISYELTKGKLQNLLNKISTQQEHVMTQASIEAPIYLHVPACQPPPKPHTAEVLFHPHWYGNTLL